jgi:hypothetical protein
MQPRRNVRCRSAKIAATSLAFAISVMIIPVDERSARAQTAEAEALFNDGNRLMAQGNLAQACDAFEASNRLEPRAGTLLNLGACREQNGQLASAWAAYKAALSRAKDPRKRELAQAKVAALAPRVSYLTVAISDDSRLEGLSLTRNSEPLDPKLWNQASPVDGGDYVIASSAPGQEPWQVIAHVPVEGGKVKVDVPRLKEPARPPPAPAVPEPRAAATDVVSRKDPSTTSTPPAGGTVWSTRRKIAVAAAATSVLAVAVGAVLGVSANGKQSDAQAICPRMRCYGAESANQLIRSGHDLAIRADVAFGVGGAAAIVAGVLWFTGAPESPGRVAIVPGAVPGQIFVTTGGSF